MRGRPGPARRPREAKLFRARHIPVAYTLPRYNKRLVEAAPQGARGLMQTRSTLGDPGPPTLPAQAPARRAA
jgi:hypothetical protein